MYLTMKYSEKLGTNNSQLIWNTNSSKIIEDYQTPSVTYNFYYFHK